MRVLLCILMLVLGLTGCTGTEAVVRPDPSTIDSNLRSNCGIIGIKESPTTQVYPPAGTLVPDFAKALERSGLADKVLFPVRPDDKPDITLDARFDVIADLNIGGNAAKSFLIGLTLFLIEPMVWLDQNYSIVGQVDIMKENSKNQSLAPKADGKMSFKWLSLGSVQQLEQDTLMKSKSSVYKQVLLELNQYCKIRK